MQGFEVTSKTAGKRLSSPSRRALLLVPALTLFATPLTLAHTLTLGYGETKQEITVLEKQVSLSPAGPSLQLSVDITPQWRTSISYQSLSDDDVDKQLIPRQQPKPPRAVNSDIDLDISAWGLSSSYYLDDWSFSASYYQSDNDVKQVARERITTRQRELADATAFGISAGYGWVSDDLFFNLSGGLQYSDWDNEFRRKNNADNPLNERSKESGDAWFVDASLSVGRYWEHDNGAGLMLGAIFSWNVNLSDNAAIVLRNTPAITSGSRIPPRRSGGAPTNNAGGTTTIGSFSQDDDYGQLVVYGSYDINPDWAVDIDFATDINSSNHANSWTVSLGYNF